MKEQSTDPDNTSMANQDRSDNQLIALVLVPQLPVLHVNGQTSVVIPMMITSVPETHGTHSHRRADQRLMSCGGANRPDR